MASAMDRAAHLVATAWRNRPRYRTMLLFQITALAVALILTFFIDTAVPTSPPTLAKRDGSFGGFDIRPQDERCYKQEKIATLLSVYLGLLGVDHWYAHHWVLAIFKLLTLGGFGVWWAIDTAFWIVGGFYGTPGCAGGCSKEWLC